MSNIKISGKSYVGKGDSQKRTPTSQDVGGEYLAKRRKIQEGEERKPQVDTQNSLQIRVSLVERGVTVNAQKKQALETEKPQVSTKVALPSPIPFVQKDIDVIKEQIGNALKAYQQLDLQQVKADLDLLNLIKNTLLEIKEAISKEESSKKHVRCWVLGLKLTREALNIQKALNALKMVTSPNGIVKKKKLFSEENQWIADKLLIEDDSWGVLQSDVKTKRERGEENVTRIKEMALAYLNLIDKDTDVFKEACYCFGVINLLNEKNDKAIESFNVYLNNRSDSNDYVDDIIKVRDLLREFGTEDKMLSQYIKELGDLADSLMPPTESLSDTEEMPEYVEAGQKDALDGIIKLSKSTKHL